MAKQETDLIVSESPEQGIVLRAKEFSASGTSNVTSIALPKDGRWLEIQLKVMALKAGPMHDQPLGLILCAVLYAEETGLSAVLGDLYVVNSRIAITADAKIRHAMNSGRINGYKVDIEEGPPVTIPYTVKGVRKEWTGPSLHATVTVKIKGWEDPLVYEADFEEWFNGANQAWQDRPRYMFRKNALSKALGEAVPLGVDVDDAPAPAGLEAAKEIVEKLKSGEI